MQRQRFSEISVWLSSLSRRNMAIPELEATKQHQQFQSNSNSDSSTVAACNLSLASHLLHYMSVEVRTGLVITVIINHLKAQCASPKLAGRPLKKTFIFPCSNAKQKTTSSNLSALMSHHIFILHFHPSSNYNLSQRTEENNAGAFTLYPFSSTSISAQKTSRSTKPGLHVRQILQNATCGTSTPGPAPSALLISEVKRPSLTLSVLALQQFPQHLGFM